MIHSERVSVNKYAQNPKALAKKKYINIKDQFTDELILRIAVHECMSICTLKQKLQQKIGGPIGQIRLRYKQQILSNNNASVAECNIKNESTIYYAPVTPMDNIGMIYPYDFDPKSNKIMAQILEEIKKGFLNKIIPKMTEEGISGSYFLENLNRHRVAIFKPLDEEPYAPNNPKGYVGKMGQKGIRNGIRSGEQGYREVVACALDPHQFHEVPPTIFVEVYHPSFQNISIIPTEGNTRRSAFLEGEPSQAMIQMLKNEENIDFIKRGSLQVFIRHTEECGNYGNTLFSVDEVHKIGILDIRILNCDRNDQNILVKKKKKKCNINPQELTKFSRSKAQMLEFDFQLIPIDHGLSLPDTMEICSDDLTWMWWDQAEQPFSQRSLEYIKKINIQNDVQMLQTKFNLREECIMNFKIANVTLQKCAKAGLTLKEIGSILFRPDTDVESTVERLIKEARHYLAACLQSGNQEILKNKIKKDNLQNNQKHQSDMPVIFENIPQEEGCLPHLSLNTSSSSDKESENSKHSDRQLTPNGNKYFESNKQKDISDSKSNGEIQKDTNIKNNQLGINNITPANQTPTHVSTHETSASSIDEGIINCTPLKRSFSLPDLQAIKIQTATPQNNNESAKKMINQVQNTLEEHHHSNERDHKRDDKEKSHHKDTQNHKHNHHSRLNGQNLTSQMLHKMKTDSFNDLLPHKQVGEDGFYICFESVLDRHIQKIKEDKLGLSKNRNRHRFISEEITKFQ